MVALQPVIVSMVELGTETCRFVEASFCSDGSVPREHSLNRRVVITVTVTNESHTTGSHDFRDRRAHRHARFLDPRGTCRISLVHFSTRPMHPAAFQVAALGHGCDRRSIKRCRRNLGFPSYCARWSLDRFGKPGTDHRDASCPYGAD